MTLLVTGAGGQVGQELARLCTKAKGDAVLLTRQDLDITNADAVAAKIEARQPSMVVNAAAYTAVDRAEEEVEQANAVNRDAPGHLARACAQAGIPLIHISTDYVFDGTKDGPYSETDPVHPLGVYGASKEAGERAVREAHRDHIILRTSWVYAAHGQNFVRTMLRVGAERDALGVVNDQHGTPTSAADIAAAVLAIADRIAAGKRDGWGTYHYTAKQATTWHGFAAEIFEQANLVKSPTVDAIPTSAYPTPAARPANSVLDCRLIDIVFAPPRRPWQEGLADVLDELLQQSGD
jgi:dTDP-4-dehydrorhamnose reductase